MNLAPILKSRCERRAIVTDTATVCGILTSTDLLKVLHKLQVSIEQASKPTKRFSDSMLVMDYAMGYSKKAEQTFLPGNRLEERDLCPRLNL